MGDATFEARCQLLKEQYEQLDEQKKQIENIDDIQLTASSQKKNTPETETAQVLNTRMR